MRNFLKQQFPLFLLTFSTVSYAQVGISDAGIPPDPSSMLDIVSNDKGVLIPRMTSAQRAGISNAANGLLVYDTDSQSFWYYASSWVELVGNITSINAGDGLSGGGANGNIPLAVQAGNGLNVDPVADQVELGGTLDQHTTITNGANNLFVDLSGGGTFQIQSGGLPGLFSGSTNNIGVQTNDPHDDFQIGENWVFRSGPVNKSTSRNAYWDESLSQWI